jgi:hypothetical protein
MILKVGFLKTNKNKLLSEATSLFDVERSSLKTT